MEFMLNKIKAFFKKYWLEFLVFGVVFSCLITCLAPDMTWIHVDSDGTEYVMDSLYFYPAHHTSAPFYLLLGHAFLQIPIGTLYWRMSLMSAIFTLGAMIFIYLIVKHYVPEKKGRYFGMLAAVIFGGSALVFAQATIVQTFAVVTFFSIAAFYFVLKKRWAWASAMIGFGLVTHHLMLLTYLALFVFNKELRPHIRWDSKFPFIHLSNVGHMAITASFGLFYLYLPLSIMFTDQPNMWGNASFGGFFAVNWAVFSMLVGQISIWDLPKRIFDTLGVLGISLGFALIPIVWWMFKAKWWKNQLFWLFILPIIYQIGNMCPQTMKYMEASIAWGAIIAVVWLAQKNIKWMNVIMAISAVAILLTTTLKFDIGRTLDPNLSATKFFEEELPKIPDGGIFISVAAWEWEEIYLYNKLNDKHLIGVSVPTLPAEIYRNMLKEQGVNVIDTMPDTQVGVSNSHELNTKQVDIALYIIAHNDNVWVSRPTDPETYGAEIIPAKGNENQISRWLGEEEVNPEVQWKPSNPYDCVSGAIEVTEWVFIIQSNKTAMKLAVYVGAGFLIVLIPWGIVERRRKKEEECLKKDK
jgi:hypothetical protein